LQARAIENMSYCIGVNRIGQDGNGHMYPGHSAVYDCLGKQLSTQEHQTAFIQTITLDKQHIQSTRDALEFLKDADDFILR